MNQDKEKLPSQFNFKHFTKIVSEQQQQMRTHRRRETDTLRHPPTSTYKQTGVDKQTLIFDIMWYIILMYDNVLHKIYFSIFY